MALYIHETGPATAPTIIFLHGGGGAGWRAEWKMRKRGSEAPVDSLAPTHPSEQSEPQASE
jgi:hypothetical protein